MIYIAFYNKINDAAYLKYSSKKKKDMGNFFFKLINFLFLKLKKI